MAATPTLKVRLFLNGEPLEEGSVFQTGDIITAHIGGGEHREVGRVVPTDD